MPELFVYAVAPRLAGRISVKGVSGELLRAVQIGRLDAIVGRVRTTPKPTDRNLRRYNRTMSALWLRAPAILPVRFGTSARDMSDLDSMIRGRERSLRLRLRATRQRAQMTVRILDRGSGIGDRGLGVGDWGLGVGERGSGAGAIITGAAFLRARAAADRAARDVPAFAPLRSAVRRFVRDERVEKRNRVASIYHLVPRGSADRYRSAIAHAARERGIRIVVSGPWPPYAFAGTW